MLVRSDKKKLFFAVLVLCAVFLRIVCLLISDNFHGIAAGKILEAQRLIQHPQHLYSWIVPAHGPIHMYLLAVTLKIFGNFLLVPRLVSLFFGIAVLFPYFWLLRLSFNDEVAVLSSFIIVFFPLHIIHSVLSTAETTFLFFLFFGLSLFVKYLRFEKDGDLIVAALFMGLSSMCRFEGGAFIGILCLFLIPRWKKLLLFLGLASVLPMIWIVLNFFLFGNFFYFLQSSDAVVRREFNFLNAYGTDRTILRKLLYWPLVIKDYFGWGVFLLGVLGICSYGGRKRNRLIFALFMSILLLFAGKTIREELAMQPRYGISLGFLFIPFAACAVLFVLQRINKSSRRLFMLLFFSGVICRGTYLTIINLPHTPVRVIQTAKFLQDNLDMKTDEVIYVDSDDNNFKEPIKLFSHIDIDRFVDFEGYAGHIELLEPAYRKRLRYIVLISDEKVFPRLKEVFRIDNCRIYEMNR